MAINWTSMREVDKAISEYTDDRGCKKLSERVGIIEGMLSVLLSGDVAVNDVRESIEKTISKEVRDEVH